ncbi:MAG: type IV secretion system DNA-binding domain-containing protein, partial [Woeseiaceae bacterium]
RKLPKVVFPTSYRATSAEHLVETYLRRTPFETFFACELSFSIPSSARFEHCHIVGGTGHGKTQLLQHLIHHDLVRAQEENTSIVVIDSQGDLIRTISHLDCFSPTAEKSLADKLILIDPNDIEHPVALNMFDVNMERIDSYSTVEREKILNGTIELYEYIFGALLGAELTQKQGVIFRYLARLMLAIPGATVQTLLALMEDGKPFKPYMEGLSGTTRKFFETQFFHPSFNATKGQILKRLWGVLSNSTFERMFSNPENKLDLFDAMNSGKIIFINTAKDLLKQEGCEIFGRFFIAMITQAAMERATIPAEKRTPTFVYIDEASDYLDEHCEALFNTARKYKVGLYVAHQNLGQLGEKLKQSIMASTSTKLAGGVSARDANAFSHEMRCSSDFIQDTRKRQDQTEFACWVKHMTPQAIKITVPLGSVEKLPVIADADYAALIEENRRRYCTSVEEIAARAAEFETALPVMPREHEEAEPEDAVPPALPKEREEEPKEAKPAAPGRKRGAPRDIEPPAPLGGGGKEHKYLQNLIKEVAHNRGFRAVIEQEILDGRGRVDVSLEREDIRVACEVSVTSTPEQELGNVAKCLAAGYDEIVVIASEPKRLHTLEQFVSVNLNEEDKERVRFFVPEAFITYLDEIETTPETREEVVRGYMVSVTHAKVDAAEAQERRKAVAQVIARSVRQMKDEPSSAP